jgi:uncharacterized membrane protein (UPF0127 family)
VVAARIRRADSFRDRFFGLMGQPALAADEGLLLPHTSSIHMFFMRTPIDCLFLAEPNPDGTQRVVGLRRRLRPWRGVVWYVRHARDVVELAPGAIDRAKLVLGDEVRLEPSTGESAAR